ncbi:MAG: hypothetical protein RLZZ210_815 [Pseudomonadota bacterium]|jgi:uncharacterized protein (DUF433 family)
MESVTINPNILNGTPVFSGTRVPIRILFEYIEAGDNINEFLDEFPSVTKEKAIATLEDALKAMLKNAYTS